MSLLLEHSSLAHFQPESRQVSLFAFTLKHSMTRRTQRTTKYIFGALAELSEKFIAIYLC
ncbi:hypothetical protein FA95DRAFT_1610077 [Auriscalpium vulgare]|uniref:Uncharacterized protein n=1 Tax=Auriscalpium vulgare TaxID=40419 RepID=A0ACB8RG62_9AGAM|nr:hypothetical protein FA95DRAFT_1610077 [Auriscalpium vulgare]